MKKSMLLATIAFATMAASAQDYKWGIGARGGLSNGLTLKHKFSENNALEVLAAARWGGFNVTALYEKHIHVFDKEHWNFYYGFGVHAGSFKGNAVNPWFHDTRQYTVIGVDGIVGLEYNFKKIPFNVSVDYKPGFNIFGYTGFWGDEGAFSLRYIF